MSSITQELEKDTFITSLFKAISQVSKHVSDIEILGRSGHGARFSLAMNTKTGREIGHPSGHYCWDVLSVVDKCFPDIQIKCNLYLGSGYFNRARATAALSTSTGQTTVHTVDTLDNISGNLVVALPNGGWVHCNDISELEFVGEFPFGPVVIDILEYNPRDGLPRSTLTYLIETLERGEEPMEIEGTGNYSTVSGWKAFARWMQSFYVPLPGVQHSALDLVPEVLYQRRSANAKFWDRLAKEVNEREGELCLGLAHRYSDIAQSCQEIIGTDLSVDDIRKLYFTEQKTQSAYKKIANYMKLH